MPWLLFLAFHAASCGGYIHSPKLYVELDTIQAIYPLKHGFQIVIPEPLLNTQLHIEHSPVIYVSASPLNPNNPSYTQYFYKLLDNRIQISGLVERSWYVVCFEFENQHRYERSGNTTTTCETVRTLDKYGDSAASTLHHIRIDKLQADRIESTLEIDTDFSMRLDVYLENAPLVQGFVVRQSQTVKVVFANLVETYKYGRICVQEVPLVSVYSAMGRLVRPVIQKCYFDNIVTPASPQGSDSIKSEVTKEFYRSQRQTSGTGKSAATAGTIALLVALCAQIFSSE